MASCIPSEVWGHVMEYTECSEFRCLCRVSKRSYEGAVWRSEVHLSGTDMAKYSQALSVMDKLVVYAAVLTHLSFMRDNGPRSLPRDLRRVGKPLKGAAGLSRRGGPIDVGLYSLRGRDFTHPLMPVSGEAWLDLYLLATPGITHTQHIAVKEGGSINLRRKVLMPVTGTLLDAKDSQLCLVVGSNPEAIHFLESSLQEEHSWTEFILVMTSILLAAVLAYLFHL